MVEPKNPPEKALDGDQAWAEIIRLYQAPGVEEAVLALQDRRGANVMVLLYLCWMAEAGLAPRAGITLDSILNAGWFRRIFFLKPIRALRRTLFPKKGSQSRLKNTLIGIEVRHERAQLDALLRISRPRKEPRGKKSVSRGLMATYLKHLGFDVSYFKQSDARNYIKQARKSLKGQRQ